MSTPFSPGISVSQSRGRLTLAATSVVPTGKPQSEGCLEGFATSPATMMTPGIIIEGSGVLRKLSKPSLPTSCDPAAVCSDTDEFVESRVRTSSSQSVASTVSSAQSSGASSPTWSGSVDSAVLDVASDSLGPSVEGARTTTRAAAVSRTGSSKTSAAANFPKTGKRGCPQQFPRKLFEMLEEQTLLCEQRPTSSNQQS
ncbi:hypothetical protein TrRE_jg8530, partial [Triparma retinervis]